MTGSPFFGLPAAQFIEFTWWDVYLIAWGVAAPAVLLALLLLWGAPGRLDFKRPRWLWTTLSLLLLTVAPPGVLWVTLAISPSGFLGRRHAYTTLEYLAYLWLPGLVVLPSLVLAGLLGWRRWTGAKPVDDRVGESRDGSG